MTMPDQVQAVNINDLKRYAPAARIWISAFVLMLRATLCVFALPARCA